MNKREWMLQAGLRTIGTGSGTADYLSAYYDAIVAASPGTEDSGWIEHRGEKPYPEGNVVVRLRDGREFTGDADAFIWTHDMDPASENIVVYRYV